MTTICSDTVGGVVYALERVESIDENSFVLIEARPRKELDIVCQFDSRAEAEAVYAGVIGAAMISHSNALLAVR